MPERGRAAQTGQRRAGMALGVSAYLLWGGLPLYLALARPAGALEVIAHRIIWSLALCALAVALGRLWPAVKAAVASPRRLAALAGASLLLTVNWLTFVWAIFNGQLVEAALGYFINPLVSVLLGVAFLGERLRPAQWAAVAVASAAVIVITAAQRMFPWVALVLAVSFGLYGYIEKRVGVRVPAVVSLSVETALIAPFALAYAVWLAATGSGTFPGLGWGHNLVLVGLGLVTAAPLLLFNAAARRLPLSVLGFVQYLCPVMHFLTGLLFFHEAMSAGRWFGFAAVWAALVTLSADAVWQARRAARAAARAILAAPGA